MLYKLPKANIYSKVTNKKKFVTINANKIIQVGKGNKGEK